MTTALAAAVFCAVWIGIGTAAETRRVGFGVLAALVAAMVIACVYMVCEAIKVRDSSENNK